MFLSILSAPWPGSHTTMVDDGHVSTPSSVIKQLMPPGHNRASFSPPVTAPIINTSDEEALALLFQLR